MKGNCKPPITQLPLFQAEVFQDEVRQQTPDFTAMFSPRQAVLHQLVYPKSDVNILLLMTLGGGIDEVFLLLHMSMARAAVTFDWPRSTAL